MKELKALYRDAVRRHAARPTGYREPIDATHEAEGLNPQCGDRVEIRMRIHAGRVEQVAFDGEACALCMASASLLCEQLAGQPLETLGATGDALAADLDAGREPEPSSPLAPLYGVRAYPSRIQCVLLPWKTAVKAL